MKKFGVVAMASLLLLELSGCGLFETGDKNSYSVDKHWHKQGAGIFEVQKAMFECGCQSSNSCLALGTNESVKAAACMEQAGFRADDVIITKEGQCRGNPTLSACRPGATISQRSVQRRLGSDYCRVCKSWKDAPEYFCSREFCRP